MVNTQKKKSSIIYQYHDLPYVSVAWFVVRIMSKGYKSRDFKAHSSFRNMYVYSIVRLLFTHSTCAKLFSVINRVNLVIDIEERLWRSTYLITINVVTGKIIFIRETKSNIKTAYISFYEVSLNIKYQPTFKHFVSIVLYNVRIKSSMTLSFGRLTR